MMNSWPTRYKLRPIVEGDFDFYRITLPTSTKTTPETSTTQKTTQMTTQKTTQKILDAISANPAITRQELALALGIGPDGVKFHLANLKKKGLLRRVGPDRGGSWEVLN